jgi:hypothetical protein
MRSLESYGTLPQSSCQRPYIATTGLARHISPTETRVAISANENGKLSLQTVNAAQSSTGAKCEMSRMEPTRCFFGLKTALTGMPMAS